MKTSRNTNGNGRSQGKGNGNGRDGHNQKGKYFYPKYLQEKLAITVLVITLALFALIMVLYRIIRDNNEQYNKIVLTQRQQEYESRVIPYRRGDIVDRNGTYLATSEKVYNLIIDPRQIMSAPERYLEPTIETLVASFGFDAGELRAMIEEKRIPLISGTARDDSSPMTRGPRLKSWQRKRTMPTSKTKMRWKAGSGLRESGLRMNISVFTPITQWPAA